MQLTISPKPWHTIHNPDNTVTIRDNSQKEIGVVKNWRDAEMIVQCVNGTPGSLFIQDNPVTPEQQCRR